MLQPVWLDEHGAPDDFPHVDFALAEPNGLLAVGGDLSPERLLAGYRRGIFPWFSEGQPILWWSPDPRTVLVPERINVRRSLRKTLRQGRFELSTDQAFSEVVSSCAAPRHDQDGTWITPDMIRAYENLHQCGFAHSVEAWQKGRLVGGLYGVALGRLFFGESMFSRSPDASKAALVHLCSLGFELIDCQLPNPHLYFMGAQDISRRDFCALLDRWCGDETPVFAPVPS